MLKWSESPRFRCTAVTGKSASVQLELRAKLPIVPTNYRTSNLMATRATSTFGTQA